MIETQIRDEKSIECGVFNFYDMNDASSVRSKSLNPNDMRNLVNNELGIIIPAKLKLMASN